MAFRRSSSIVSLDRGSRLPSTSRTPQQNVPFISFDSFEEFVRRVNAGLVSARRDEIISDGEARVELHAITARYGRRSRKAA